MPETKLKLYQTNGLDILYNPQVFEDKQEWARKLVEGDGNPHDSVNSGFEALFFGNWNRRTMDNYLKANGFEELVKLNALRFGLENKADAALVAPGDIHREEWVYNAGDELIPVQDWVRAHDGEYALLFVGCPRPAGAVVHSHHSAVVVPRGGIGEFDEGLDGVSAKLYLPGFNYVRPEQADATLRTLRALVAKRHH